MTADESLKTLAGASKYSREHFVYPSPHKDPENFFSTLQKEVISRHIDVLLPMTEVSTNLVLKHQEAFSDLTIPCCPLHTFEWLNNKYRLFELAQEMHIPIPTTYFVQPGMDMSAVYEKLTFPAVLKPYRSWIWSNDRWLYAAVKHVSSLSELEKEIKGHESFREHPYLIQTHVQGQGQGVFALYDRGKLAAFFAHKRLREKPPSGGVSVLSESIELDPRMREIAEKILGHVRYHGVAMVEFKVSSDGTPYLMEVNARFWGSLQLAIDAGVDFPYLLYKMATGHTAIAPPEYNIGIKNRWLLGDTDHLYIVLKSKVSPILTWRSKLKTIFGFLRFFQKGMRYEILRWKDINPFLYELRYYFKLKK